MTDGTTQPKSFKRSPAPMRRPRPVSPLSIRILVVNVVALMFLFGGLLYLGRYQGRLIDAELESLKTEAKVFAALLGETAVTLDSDDNQNLSEDISRQIVRRLTEATGTRTRVVAGDGHIIADSHQLSGPGGEIEMEALPPPGPMKDGPVDFITRWLSNILTAMPERRHLSIYIGVPETEEGRVGDSLKALGGEIAATAWVSDGNSLYLTAAAPIQRYKQVMGVVLLSKRGDSIDEAIRNIRLDIFNVFLAALAFTIIISLYLARNIYSPLFRLANAAERVRLGQGGAEMIPDFANRADEIGDLSSSLREMTGTLRERMESTEHFAADVAHELKNPLSSMRSALETLDRISDPARREKLMRIIHDDVIRLDRLITDIAAASRLEAEMARIEPGPVDIAAILAMLAGVHETARAPDDPHVVADLIDQRPLIVNAIESRLVQVLQNLIGNALSFSPPQATVRAIGRQLGDRIEIRVEDEGPGIPDGKLTAIFDRFYSERPATEKFGTHSGLGLSIAKQIVEAHGGTITAKNLKREDGTVRGACFTILLPAMV